MGTYPVIYQMCTAWVCLVIFPSTSLSQKVALCIISLKVQKANGSGDKNYCVHQTAFVV